MNKGPVEGQLPAFFEEAAEQPEVPYLGPGVAREEVLTRAGTKLDHRWTHRIEGKGRKGTTQHGLYDERQRVYQTGGELSNFVFWKRKLVTFAYEAWQQVFMRTDWFEIIDHERNECWRISGEKARNNAVKYDAGLGTRIGIPMELFDVITSRGTYKQEGKAS